MSARAERERERDRQVPLFEPPASTELPALSLLDDPPPKEGGYSAEALEAMSRLVELKLADFGVEAEVVAVHPGPVVTTFGSVAVCACQKMSACSASPVRQGPARSV